MVPSEEAATGLRSLLVSVRRERELAHAALQTEKKHAEEVETALRELQSKGDIDEALRREEEAKQALEQSQKLAEQLLRVSTLSTQNDVLYTQLGEVRSILLFHVVLSRRGTVGGNSHWAA